jgi:predicted membrane chloride channel (bestrophin family)
MVFGYNTVFLSMTTESIALRSQYPELQLPLTPFELTAPVLGLLLVFRTDTAYERFNEGSQLAWEMTASMRTFIRRLRSYTSTFSEGEQGAASEIIEASCLLHGFILNSWLRDTPLIASGADIDGRTKFELQELQSRRSRRVQAEVIGKALGVSQIGADGENRFENLAGNVDSVSPYVCFEAIALGVSQRLPSLTDQEAIAIDDGVASVSTHLACCEKLVSTPIPLGYTRSTVRFSLLWISLLPFALSRTFSEFSIGTWWQNQPLAELPVLLFVMVFISFVFLSIEDIAVQIEEPFAILPLEVQHERLLRDIQQMDKLQSRCSFSLGSNKFALTSKAKSQSTSK